MSLTSTLSVAAGTGLLSNDTDPDSNDSKTVSAVRLGNTAGSGTAGTVGNALAGSYGSLTLHADGSYSYVLDNSNATVQALGSGEHVVEHFNYTMTDSGNNVSSATFDITINGTNDAPVLSAAQVNITQTEKSTTVTSVSSLLTNPGGGAIASDVDQNTSSRGVAITAAPTADATSGMTGTWQYHLNTDGADVWTAFPSVDAAHALLLSGTAQVRYVVNPDTSTSVRNDTIISGAVSLSYRAWDRSAGVEGSTASVASVGGATAFSTASLTASMDVTPVNDAPVLTQNTITLTEKTGLVLSGNSDPHSLTDTAKNLYLFDPDNTDVQLMYRVEELPTKGTLYKSGVALGLGNLFTQADVAGGLITYTYTGGELSANTTDTFRISLRDGAGGVIGTDGATGSNPWATITLDITDVNAQVNAGKVSYTAAEYLNSGDHLDLTGLTPVDADAAGSPALYPSLTVVDLPTSTTAGPQGSLQYWNGSAYVDFTAADLKLGANAKTFTSADLAAHPLRYISSDGEPTAYGSQVTFSVYVDDGGRTGNAAVASTATTLVTIGVTPVNDPPTPVVIPLSVDQGSSGNAIGTSHLSATDPDSPTANRVYTVSVNPTQGYLSLSGVRIGAGATFTEADLVAGRLTYSHNGAEPADNNPATYEDHFNFTINDGDVAIVSSQLDINVVNINNAPLPSVYWMTATTIADFTITTSNLDASDPDTSSSLRTYSVNSLPTLGTLLLNGSVLSVGSTFTQADLAGTGDHVLTYHRNVTGDTQDSFTFTVYDHEAITAPPNRSTDGTFYINPTAGVVPSYVGGTLNSLVAEGSFVALNSGQLNAGSGADGFKLTANPTHGTLYLDGVALVSGDAAHDTFTAAQIASGEVVYVSDGTEPANYLTNPYRDTFGFTRTDGSNASTFTLAVTPVNDAPTIGQTTASATIEQRNTSTGSAAAFDLASVTNAVKLDTSYLSASDPDTANSQLYYVLAAAPTNGVLKQWNGSSWSALALASRFNVSDISAGNIAYFHNASSEVRADSIQVYLIDGGVVQVGDVQISTSAPYAADKGYVTVTDSAGSIQISNGNYARSPTHTVSFTITNVNDAPVAANTTIAIDEGTGETQTTPPTNPASIQVLSTSILSVTDSDNTVSDFSNGTDTGYFQISVLPTHGDLYLNGVKVAATGTKFSYAQLSTGLLEYRHNGSEPAAYNYQDTFGYQAVDPLGAASNIGTVTVDIRPVNDPPLVVNNGPATAIEGGAVNITASLLGSPTGSLVDPDNSVQQVQYRFITSNVLHGKLYIGDATTGALIRQLAVGSAITLEDIQLGRVWYQHDGSEPMAYATNPNQDSFSYQISDSSGMTEPTATLLINLIRIDTAPAIDGFGGTKAFVEDGSAVVLAPDVSFSDIDKASNSDTAANLNFAGGSLTVQLADAATHGADQLAISALGGVTSSGTTVSYNGTAIGTIGSSGANGADLVVAFNADTSAAAIQALARAVTFVNTDHANPDTTTRNIQFVFNDGGGTATHTDSRGVAINDANTSTGTIHVTVARVNDAPSIDAATVDLGNDGYALNENATSNSGVLVSAFIQAGSATAGAQTGSADVDVNDMPAQSNQRGIAITAATQSPNIGHWEYSINSGSTWSVVGSVSGSGALLLRSTDLIRFIPDARNGTTASITYRAWDQFTGSPGDKVSTSSNGGTTAFSTATDTASVVVTSVNDAPTRNGSASITPAGLTVTEDVVTGVSGNTVANLLGASFSDVDTGSSLAGVAITANGSNSIEGHWQYSTDNGASWNPIANDGTITTGHALVLAASDTIRFLPDASNYNGTPGSLSARLIDNSAAVTSGTFVDVSDNSTKSGGSTQYSNSTNALAINATVAAVNDPPTLTIANTSFSATEATVVDLSSAGFTLADVEATRNEGSGTSQGKVQVTLSNADGVIHVAASGSASISGNDSGTVTIKGSLTEVAGSLSGLSYTTGNNPNTSESISVVLSDLGNNGTGSTTALTTSGSITIAVTQLNEAPTATDSATLAAVNEDAGQTGPIPNYPGSSSNPEPSGDTIANLFASNFQDVDTQGSNHALVGIAVVGNAAIASTEGVWQYNTGSGWVTISSSGSAPTDTTALVLSRTASLRFLPNVANYNGTPGSLTVRLSDGTGFTAGTGQNISGTIGGHYGWTDATVALSTSVTAVNDAPIIYNLNGDQVSFTQAVGVNVAGSAVLLDDTTDGHLSATLADVDLLGSGTHTYHGATLTVQDQIAANRSNDFFVIQTGINNVSISGGFTTPSGLKLFNNGSSVNYNGVSVATITNNSSGNGTLVLTFYAAASSAAVNAILQNLAYSNNNVALTSMTKDIDVTFSDGNGAYSDNAQGTGGALPTTATVHIGLHPTNQAPSFTSGYTIASAEDTAPLPLTATAFSTLLGGSNFTDPNGLSSNLAGVAVGSFDGAGVGTWKVSLNGTDWVDLATISSGLTGGISASKALVLSKDAFVEFVPDPNANTAGLVTPPRLVVFAVESAIPTGASDVAGHAPAVSLTTDLNAPVTYNTTTDTAEARVSVAGVNIDVQIAARNDAPSLGTSTWTGTLLESPVVGIGTSQQQLVLSASVGDIDLASTQTLNSTIFGAGSITVSLSSRTTGDKFTLGALGLAEGVASSTGADVASGDYVIQLSNTATIDQVKAILEAIRFENTTDAPPAGQRSYTITLNDGNNAQPGGNAGGPASLTSIALTGAITITQSNDPPIGVGDMTLTTLLEDPASNAGEVIAALTGYHFVDDDTASPGNAVGGIAVISNTATGTQGSWQYSSDGTNWHDVGTVGDTNTTQALVLSVKSKLRFVPVANYNGTPPALTVRALDNTYAAGTTTWDGSAESRILLDTSQHGTNSAISNNTNTISMAVTAVNDAPTISGLDATSVNAQYATPYVQAGNRVSIDRNATFFDQELATERNNWNGATLTLQRQGTPSTDDVFSNAFTLYSISTASGNVVLAKGPDVTVGTYTNSGGVLTFTFNGNATTALVNETLYGIAYNNAVTTPGGLSYNSVTLDVTINDQNSNVTGGGTAGTGQDQGNGGRESATGSIIINIDRLPIASADTASVNEGVTTLDTSTVTGDVTPASTSGGNVADTDQDGDTLTVQGVAAGNVGGVQASNVASDVTGSYGKVNMAADGSYTYTLDNTKAAVQALAIGQCLSDTFTYTINDARGGTSTTILTVTIHGTNDAPILSDTALAVTQTEDAATPSGAVGTLVSSLASSSNISDLDTSNPKGIAITATDSNRGSWYYSTNGGSNWTSFTATDTTARLLLGDASTRIYFQPTANWQGSVSAALTLRAWDASTGSNGGTADVTAIGTGGTTAFSAANDVVDLTVTSVNDQPVSTSNVTLGAFTEDISTPAGAALNTLSFGYNDATDNQTAGNGGNITGGDTSTTFTYLAIVGSTNYTAGQGVWQISKTNTPSASTPTDWIDIPVSGLSTTSALTFNSDQQVRFVAASNYFGTPGTLTVRLADASVDLSGQISATNANAYNIATYGGTSTTGAWDATSRTIGTTVTNVNDQPTASATILTATTEDLAEGVGGSPVECSIERKEGAVVVGAEFGVA